MPSLGTYLRETLEPSISEIHDIFRSFEPYPTGKGTRGGDELSLSAACNTRSTLVRWLPSEFDIAPH